MSTLAYYRPMRRLGTGLDSVGRSCVVSDAASADTSVATEYVLDDLWSMGLLAEVAGSVDWVTVLSGSVILLLEEGDIALGSRDRVVQRNTLHGWRSLGSEPCFLIAAMASVHC